MKGFLKKMPAGTKAEILYILFPLLLMAMIKINTDGWVEVFLAPDWSLVSCILFGQTSYTIIKAVIDSRFSLKSDEVGFYISIRLFWLSVALVSYVLMTLKANVILGVLQIILFVFSIRFYLKDKILAEILQKDG